MLASTALEAHLLPASFCPAAYGKVFQGRWNGAVVAVKVIEHRIVAGDGAIMSREPLLWWVNCCCR
jgi:hypothetical protein